MMLDKINIGPIIHDHFATLRSHRTKQASPGDYLVQWVIPAVIAATCATFGVKVNKDIATILATAISIFGGLLFNLMMLVYSIIEKTADEYKEKGQPVLAVRKKILQEVFANVTFSIVIAIATVPVLIIATWEGKNWIAIKVLSFGSLFLGLAFGASLLMILRRAYLLMKDQFNHM